jgi:hypothetical protein
MALMALWLVSLAQSAARLTAGGAAAIGISITSGRHSEITSVGRGRLC